MAEYYSHLVKCDCGAEWVIIAENFRTVVPCDGCGLLNDIYLEDYLLTGTVEDVVEYMEKE